METLLTPQTFSSVLDRERARSDRNGQPFSILLCNVHTTDVDRLQPRISRIRGRLRCYDVVGWVDSAVLAVLLPDTSYDGACSVADMVFQEVLSASVLERRSIYTYPMHWGVVDATGDDAHTDTPAELRPIDAWARANQDLQQNHGITMGYKMPVWKRLMDIAGALIALTLTLPLFVLLGAYIKLISPGPMFFKQRRVGFLGESFVCWKFRTMHQHADVGVHRNHLSDLIHSEGAMTKLDNQDRRIIPLGRVLRKTGLDELPQLFNVLAGDMSLIGPRPCIPYEAEQFENWQRRRFDTVPGITGLWQVSGKNRTTFKQMMRFDITYAKKKNLLVDTLILIKTLPAVIKQVTEQKS